MSKECKCICQEMATIHDPYKIYIKFGKSPGRYKRCTKMCLTCEYWTNDFFTKENKCFCCGNKYRHRKHTNLIEILDRNWRSELRMMMMVMEQTTNTTNNNNNNNNNNVIDNKYIVNLQIKNQ